MPPLRPGPPEQGLIKRHLGFSVGEQCCLDIGETWNAEVSASSIDRGGCRR